MKLSPPKLVTWWVCFVICVISVLMLLGMVSIPALAPYALWLPVAGLAIMLFSGVLTGL